jgi:hypothetical protein
MIATSGGIGYDAGVRGWPDLATLGGVFRAEGGASVDSRRPETRLRPAAHQGVTISADLTLKTHEKGAVRAW